jgi:hypothetical protein
LVGMVPNGARRRGTFFDPDQTNSHRKQTISSQMYQFETRYEWEPAAGNTYPNRKAKRSLSRHIPVSAIVSAAIARPEGEIHYGLFHPA